jgi:hypothetical protein
MRVKAATVLTALVLLTLKQSAAAQTPEPREASRPVEEEAQNVIALELGGPGLLYSVSYERFLLPNFSVRVGASLFGLRENTSGDTLVALPIPLSAQYVAFDGAHHLELGAGLLTGVIWSDLNSYDETETFGLAAATATVGYRYQPARGGWVFRVALTPMYGGRRFQPLGLPITPWGSVVGGYAF